MLNKVLVLVWLVVATTGVIAGPVESSLRSASSAQKFHHHVVIKADAFRNCSGSIINTRWILSSATCLSGQGKIVLELKSLDPNEEHPYSVTLKNPEVFQYPTPTFDIALLKLPVNLISDTTLSTIPIWQNSSDSGQTLGVMPGVENNVGSLVYGTYQITDGKKCEWKYPGRFDSTSQICVKGWQFIDNNIDCNQASGAGLLIGWPKAPTLIGIYSLPESCKENEAFIGVFTDVGKYAVWISDITNGNTASSSITSRRNYSFY